MKWSWRHPTQTQSDEEEAPSTEQQVQEALQNLPSARDIQVQLRPCDKTEDVMVAQFASAGCGCSKKCSKSTSGSYSSSLSHSYTHTYTHHCTCTLLFSCMYVCTRLSIKIDFRSIKVPFRIILIQVTVITLLIWSCEIVFHNS